MISLSCKNLIQTLLLQQNLWIETPTNFNPILDDYYSIQIFIKKMTTTNIQYWMLLVAYKFHPKRDDMKHPILDVHCIV